MGQKEAVHCVKNMAFLPVLLLVLVSMYHPAFPQGDVIDWSHVYDKRALSWTDGRKFYCSNHITSHQDADAKCRANGMSLALVEDRPLLNALWNHCRSIICVPKCGGEQGIWLGNAKCGGEQGIGNEIEKSNTAKCELPMIPQLTSNFRVCANGLVLDSQDLSDECHSAWGGVVGNKYKHIWYPDRGFNKGKCFEIFYHWVKGYGLNDQDCSHPRHFACEDTRGYFS